MDPRDARRSRHIGQRGAPHTVDGDGAPNAPAVAVQRGHHGPPSSPPVDASPPDLAPGGSLWRRVGREIASWRRGTVSIHEVDAWLRFNPYIRRGFRHRLLRKREAVGSLVLYFHNETFNIASHLAMVALLVMLLLWPPQVPATSSGVGGPGTYDGEVGDCRLHTAAASPRGPTNGGGSVLSEHQSGAPLSRHRRDDAEVPSWLRGLHGLVAASRAAAVHSGDDSTPGYMPPCDAAASPRHPMSVSAATAAATASVALRFFTFSLGGSAAPSSLGPTLSGPDTAPSPPPMSVAARLTLSLTPLLLGFLLTFALSVLYHMFMPCCRSRRGYQQLLQCDVMGVFFAICSSAYTYFSCGMPCADESVQAWSGALMVVATLLCIYVLVLAPMWGVLAELCANAGHLAQWVVAAAMAATLDFLMGRPLLAAPPCPPLTRRDGHERDRPPPPPDPNAGQHPLVAWVQRYRCRSSARLSGALAVRSIVEPVHVSALQRVAVGGAYCLLHLCVYVTLVYPKSFADKGGFTQATHYHSASYAWLFVGGLFNAARFPEVVVFHWTRRAARHARRVAAAEEAAWCAEALRRDAAAAEVSARAAAAAPSSSRGSARSALPPSVKAPTLWDRLCVPKRVVTYIVSASTLDYIGNSHNIWHACTVLSALSSILAVYYDCIEYDLVQCG
ncbi:hypothetical protein LSCM1_07983 [Leishmania martiniquensis]|uniref:Haemolysin-III related n=1 Tax=Leishmania martiniquensis TaxID=1580590 RepID=A0A836H8E7_9TRYP|nr:hypothetical protein LSCM1_07983 [Leishmania martiniquensis]